MTAGARDAAAGLWDALGGATARLAALDFRGAGTLPSCFAVSDLASAAWGVAALAVAELAGGERSVRVDRRLASMWFKWSVRPQGWQLPATVDPVSGDYATADGWVRIHANAPHHRAAALKALGVAEDRALVTARIATLAKADVEAAVVGAGGCAAQMRDMAGWAAHPQGRAVAGEPLVHYRATDAAPPRDGAADPTRPLGGLRVLDLTRVLAGPIATRFLAGFGADVLRIDPIGWDEGMVIPEVTPGKRCARIDLRTDDGRATALRLIEGADIIVHGYRAQALERLGLGEDVRRAHAPGLVDVRLNAYGWTGPWTDRRGYDSLVQMSNGIAQAGMNWADAAKPTPLPVQALDHTTGYLMAAAALRGVLLRRTAGHGSQWRLSLARTGHQLIGLGLQDAAAPFAWEEEADFSPRIERTDWGDALRLKPPLDMDGLPMAWASGARKLGSDAPRWA